MCQVGPNTLSTEGSLKLTGDPAGEVIESRRAPFGSGCVQDSTKTILAVFVGRMDGRRRRQAGGRQRLDGVFPDERIEDVREAEHEELFQLQ